MGIKTKIKIKKKELRKIIRKGKRKIKNILRRNKWK